MSEGAVVVREGEKAPTLTEIVSAGVGQDYEPAYVAAMRSLLPVEFQDDPVNVIAIGIRAKMSGLNPFTQIHAWKGDRGQLTFQTDYKGFIDIAARDPRVESLEFQHVYEGEDFQWTKQSDGKILVQHTGGLKKGRLLGVYCVAHMAGDMADHMEMRLLEDFKHLFNKTNWRNNPSEMLTARVVSATVRVVCPESSQGLYTEADWDSEAMDLSAAAAGSAQAATVAAQEELAARLGPVEAEVVEIEGPTVESGPSPEAASFPTPGSDTDTSPAEGFEEKRFHCGYCITDYDNQRSLAGHGRKHRAEKAMEKELPEGFAVVRTDGHFAAYDADGVIIHQDDTWVDCYTHIVASIPSIGPEPDPVAVVPQDQLEVPEGYRVFVDRGGQHVATIGLGGDEIGRYHTHDDAALACINHAHSQPDPTEPEPSPSEPSDASSENSTETFEVPKLAEIYRRVADSGHKTTEVIRVLNSVEYEDTFSRYRRDGASQVEPLNLDEDGRRELVDVLTLRGIIAS